jgi:hypothetical protein
MKKVRYAWGTVAAVPVLGMMMPPATVAAAQARHTTAKTVSLQHSAAASGCTGNTRATAGNLSVKLKFWHTYHPAYATSCIGTVSTSFFIGLKSSESDYDRIRIYAHSLGGAKHMVYHTSPKAKTGNQHIFGVGVHRSFGYLPIQVCAAAVHGNGSVFEGPVCKSVG